MKILDQKTALAGDGFEVVAKKTSVQAKFGDKRYHYGSTLLPTAGARIAFSVLCGVFSPVQGFSLPVA